ncbi:hypothetical protein DYB37_011438 [Aphanomyces astaci]|uniref:D-3-phosphoglycerate dehydrogenase n=1 Tax=Aphanomyces astaci TaxID=112090 RepID=A0A418FSK9_APHAT|nr:hypothetical protein DYB37_011438 [Aphanomyces astaci]
MWHRALRGSVASHRRGISSAVAVTTHKPSFSDNGKRVLCLNVGNLVCIDEFLQHGFTVDEASSHDVLGSLSTFGPSLAQYDALLTDDHTKLPMHEILTHATRLKLIGIPGSQTGHVNLLAATNRGVMVQNIGKKLAGTAAVEAEMVLSLLLHVARKIPQAMAATKRGDGGRDGFLGHELQGKAMGIVGLNETGQLVGELASAMGMHVYAYDPTISTENAASVGVTKCASLTELYGKADVLTFHVPLTGLTRNMFDGAALAQCKPGVTLVSVGGMEGVIDEAILLPALASGQIAGVAVDLSTPSAWSAAIVAHPSVLPATSNSTKANLPARLYKMIAENMCATLDHRAFIGIVNGVFMPLTLVPEMKPFLALGESLGRFLVEILPTPAAIAHVTITTKGGRDIDITAPKARSAIQNAVMKGLLQQQQQRSGGNAAATSLTLLNASVAGMSQGIDVRLTDDLDQDIIQHLNNAIQVQVELQSGEKSVVMGSVFGEEPRIVQVGEYNDFPAFKPQGTMLFFNNEDRPGAITGVLDQLAKSQINIASLGLARQPDKPQALGMLALDSDPADDIVAKLRALQGITNVHVVRL